MSLSLKSNKSLSVNIEDDMILQNSMKPHNTHRIYFNIV